MDEEKLSQIFIPDISKDNDNLLNSDLNLAYYTSAGTLFSILKYKQLWLRSTMCMNDYQDIKYAFEYVKATFVLDYAGGVNGLPAENMLQFTLEDKCSVIVRPSGTEPKLKTYIYAIGESKAQAEQIAEDLIASSKELLK